MIHFPSHPKARLIACAAALIAVSGAILFWLRGPAPRLMLAPMMGLDVCITPFEFPIKNRQVQDELDRSCQGAQGSAATLIESTLSRLEGPVKSQRFELGYTLNVPLLKLFKARDGDWVIDQEQLGRIVRTLRDIERPTVLYLFSTHFSQLAPIERSLAADPANLSWTQKGPLPTGKYYTEPIYNWSVANMQTAITERRIQAANAVLQEICKLEPRHIAKVRGVTLLGELHHLFPDFEAGMGFKQPYLVSDYSAKSRADFRRFLERRFGNVGALNKAVGGHWKSFEEVDPPSKDIRTEKLRDFFEHIDSFAHGSLPISGWAYVKESTVEKPALVRIYRNGDLLGKAPVSLGRQDVLEALHEFGTANTGWRFDMDFRKLTPGLHRIDIFLENGPKELVHLGTRNIAIVDSSQKTPQPQPQKALPDSRLNHGSIKAYIDVPTEMSSYFYNPLVPIWHDFRNTQIVDYLQKFSQATAPSCLSRRFTHQIIPFTNPGWDETKFAIDASLRKLPGIEMGVSLYGEPTYGTSFSQWITGTGHKRYGITEFHPLKALNTAELSAVFEMHERHGAEFLSFFLEPRWKGHPVSHGHNLFSFDSDNPKYGSDKLYESVQQILAQPKPGATGAP